jgi:hypothetical protein
LLLANNWYFIGRGVLPITTIVNLPTTSYAYNQIILTTSSIIFDDGQFDPDIASHDIAIRITGNVFKIIYTYNILILIGPIPTKASIVSYYSLILIGPIPTKASIVNYYCLLILNNVFKNLFNSFRTYTNKSINC